MYTTDRQVRKLRMEYQRDGRISAAAMKADMDRQTASKYLKTDQLPSERRVDRYWRTRENPFAAHWPKIEQWLTQEPGLEAKTIFEALLREHAGAYQEGQLRTLQRQVHRWHALQGPGQEVFFPQHHVPGERLQTDFTHCGSLRITILGEPYAFQLCHSVLTYSNWEHSIRCQSESLLALSRGVQTTLVALGHVPLQHWTDHSTAATHQVDRKSGGERGFNVRYLQIMSHFGLEPRTIQKEKPNENGDVESANGAFKNRLDQALMLRGGRDFDSLEALDAFIRDVERRANEPRRKRLAEELARMRKLEMTLLPEYIEEIVSVSKYSTIQCDKRAYSVPSRLIGERVRTRRYEQIVEVWFGGALQHSMPRLTGERIHSINYRHVINSLMRKPHAFARYKYREDLFPSLTFRTAYDRLCAGLSERQATLEYLGILQQAARDREDRVEAALEELEARNVLPRLVAVREFLPDLDPVHPPRLNPLEVDLPSYDSLLNAEEVLA